MHLLIVGCGYIGLALAARAREIHGNALAVSAIRRNVAALPAGVRPVGLDLSGPEPVPRLDLPQVDCVVFCAAPGTGDAAGYEAVYERGTTRVLAALAAEGHAVRNVLFVSSTGVYGQDDGQVVDESTPTAPERYQGRIMLRAEAAARASGWPTCILRCGGIYGPERAGMLRRLREGRAPWPVGKHYTNRIHRDDCVGAILHLWQRAERAPVYNIVDDLAAEQGAILRHLAHRLGLPLPAPLPSETESTKVSGKRISNARLRADGYACRFPTYREGFDAILRADG